MPQKPLFWGTTLFVSGSRIENDSSPLGKTSTEVAKTARKEVEKRIGRSVVSPEKAIDHIQSPEEQ